MIKKRGSFFLPTNFGAIGKQAPRVKPNSIEHLNDTLNTIKPKNIFLRDKIGRIKQQTERKSKIISTVNSIKKTLDLPLWDKNMSKEKMLAAESKLYIIKTSSSVEKSRKKFFNGDSFNFKHEILKMQNIEKLEMTFIKSQQKIHENISKIRSKVYNKKPIDDTLVEQLKSSVKSIHQKYKGVAQRIDQSMRFALPMKIEQEGKQIQKMKKTFFDSTGHRRTNSERIFKPVYLENKNRLEKIPTIEFKIK